MAFDIALDPHGTGLAARYWRITQTHIDHLQGQVTVWLHGWADEIARTELRTAAASLTLLLHAADFSGTGLHAVDTATLYRALKARAAASPADRSLQPAHACPGAAILADARDC